MEPIIIPLWAICIASLLGIYGIIFSLRYKKSHDSKMRSLMLAIPRIYFFILYTIFWLGETPLDIRAIYGRYGIFAILAVDALFCLQDVWNYHSIGTKLVTFYKNFIENIKIQIRRGNL